jgi:FkbM family methyltransferase
MRKKYGDRMNVEEMFETALENHRSGRLGEAEKIYRQIIADHPDEPDALHLLGVVAYQKSDPDTAISFMSKAASINKNSPEYHCNLGNAYKMKGNHLKAVRCYREAIRLKPDYAEAYNNLGATLKSKGKHKEALEAYHRAIRFNPGYAAAYCNLGNLYRELGDPGKASESYQKSIDLQPDNVDALKGLGETCLELGRTDEAVKHLERASELNPVNSAILFSLAGAFHRRRERDKAAEFYRKVLDQDPDNADAWNNLGTALIDSGNVEEGVSVLRQGATLNPNSPEIHYNIGKGLERLDRLGEALSSYEKSLDLNPHFSTAWNNIGNIHKDQGNCEKALSYYRTALKNSSSDTTVSKIPPSGIHSNLLFTMHYSEAIDPDKIFNQHREWESTHASSLKEYIPAHENDVSPNRRLRIGYVSPDFRSHSVAYFMQSILAAHDRTGFEIFCYSNVEYPDAATELFKKMADHWRDIYGPDEMISDMIQRDRIDILVDLAGHTGNNRLTLFARKPAPVQVTYLGYPNTTGLAAIDYRITDAFADPVGITDKWHSEKLVRLQNCFLCYRPPEGTPGIADLPAMKSGYITFGSFNNRAKITQRTIETWSGVLHALPDARLILKAKSLSDPQVKEQLMELFRGQDIDQDRITILGFTASKKDHFELYNTIDIALDTFPYNGTTTTCEALWMGAPVIALKGDIHVSRVGYSILSNIGLAELAADSSGDYIAKAVRLAGDIERLRYLRSSLRDMMKKSPLMDAQGFTLNLENEFRTMWLKWCSDRKIRPDTGSLVNLGKDINLKATNEELERLIREGETLFGSGQKKDAADALLKALELDNNNAAALNNLGVIYYQEGQYDRAEHHIIKAIASKPDVSAYHCNLGNVFKAAGKKEQAVLQYERAIQLNPDFALAHNNLGTVFRELNKHEEAIASFKRALAIQDDYAEAYYNLGNVYRQTKDYQAAIESYEKAIALHPGDIQAYNNLGNVFMEKGDPDLARSTFEKAIRINPSYAQAHNNLGNALRDLGRPEDALEAYTNAVELQPGYANAYYNMANTLKDMNMLTKAAACYRKAIELQPVNPEAYNNLGNLYKDQGRIRDALSCYEKAVEITPGYAVAHSNLLLALHYDKEADPDTVFLHHEEWAKRHASAFIDKVKPHINERTENRIIRIGYVSPDFRIHSVSYFIRGILSSHDSGKFEVYCYSDVVRPDSFTKEFKTLAHQWRDIRGMSDDEAADLIRQDKIDILVDLAGHTGNNRLLVFPRKPAPVQVTYLGYPDTTGLKAIDYRLTDCWADPQGHQDDICTEKLVRLPGGFLCYQTPKDAPQVKKLPALAAGCITFGSFNHRPKITEKTVQTWSRILKEVPDSRLILKSGSLSDSETRDLLLDMFCREGISKDRITLLGDIPSFFDHLDLYNKIDIALDTFPYNGTTTTCEALWMGVPVITLKGNTHAARVGMSILTNAGLPDLIAESEEDYIQKARALAMNIEQLKSLRSNLRNMLVSSALMDARRFTQNIEDEYRKMWHTWCGWCGINKSGKKEGEMKEDRNNQADNLGQNPAQSPSELSFELTREGEDYFNAGRIEDAQKAFDRALEIDPMNVSALNNLGVLSWHRGDTEKAIDRFQQVLKLDPGNEDAKHNLQEIQKKAEPTDASEQPDDAPCLQVAINGEIRVCVPPSIQFMTPYILIEQEDWFEEEIHYIRKILREGMNVIDIGANYGLYTLTMSKIIGPSGKLWAFEPTSLTASYLKRSISTNRVTNVTLVQAGLSDKKGTARISLNPNPELNAITSQPDSNGEYETVALISLDECEGMYGWDNIDFIKLDAEGQEHNIITGGKHFLSTRSPLIMFELKHGDAINSELINDFSNLGYQPYHLVPGLNILAPADLNKPFDPFQLNLFCCKADRAQILQEQGLLITEFSSPSPASKTALWQQELQDMPYFNVFKASWASIEQGATLPGWDHYENALNCYVSAHSENQSAYARYASLHQAWEEISRALNENVNISRLLTQVRIQSELGKRGDSIQTVDTILKLIESGKTVMLSEPFVPVSERFDRIIPKEMNKWLIASILEYRQKAKGFSSFYTGKSTLDQLEIMKGLGYQTPEMERRRQLIRMRYGLQNGPVATPLLSTKARDNLNPEIWKANGISGGKPQNIVSQLGASLEERIQIVDIGAMDIGEAQNPYERLLAGDLACIIGFEPLEQECKKLNESSSANRRFLPYAVGDGTKKPFYITNTGMTSSLFEPNHDLTIKFQNLDELMQVIKTEEMQTVRLDDIPEIIDTDFLKIDVQGAEKMILENAARMLKNTLVIQTEVEFVPLYKNQPLFADVDRTLRSHGFEFHKFLGTAGRSFKPLFVKGNINVPISQILWADAVYVKNFMELDALSEQKLLKYAVIMHEVFRSLDLCHLVLTQYDRKTGMSLSQRYLNLINKGKL